MPERAQVRSVEAIESFRGNLILYMSKARPTLEEISANFLRTRLWLQNEQRMHWENEVRRRTKELDQAQQALARVRLSSLGQTSIGEQKGVQNAKRALEEADAKLKTLKRWNREFDSRVEPLVKQLEKLHTVLANDMLKATAYLAHAIKTLRAYSEIAPPSAPTTASEPGSESASAGLTSTAETSVPPESKPGGPRALPPAHS